MQINNIVGIMGAVIALTSFSFKNDTLLKLLLGVGCILTGISYLLIKNYPGFLGYSLTGVRCLVSVQYRGYLWAMLFILLHVFFGVYYMRAWIDFLPIFSSFIGCLGVFIFSGSMLRASNILVSAGWIIFNSISGNIPGVIMESGNILSCLFGIENVRRSVKRGQ